MERAVRLSRTIFTKSSNCGWCRSFVHSSSRASSTSNPGQKLSSSEKEEKKAENDNFEHVTIFHKPSDHMFDIKLKSGGSNHFSFFLRKSNHMVNLSFAEKFRHDGPKSLVDKEPSDTVPPMQSINEIMWKEVKPVDWKKLPQIYMQLSKIRLTGLVVMTTMAGFVMAPAVFNPLTFAMCTVGTALNSSAANAINQYFEVPYDSQMNRTKNRPLVRGVISPLHGVTFAAVAGLTGSAILFFCVNPLTAGLGAFNLALYALAYTPMKRVTIYNTWVGAVVGAIPPMMGWTACAGTLDPGAWLLGGILFAWQFPHFKALSWNLRQDYSRAGYRMTCVTNPEQCKRVALRYSIALLLLCPLAPIMNVTTWTFAADSLPINLCLTYLAWNFYRQGDSNSSRKLFRFTLIHIPAILILMLISKTHNAESAQEDSASAALLPEQGI